MERLRITIQGQVQGVGFRPYVYRIANQLGLSGWIQNHPIGVLIEVQGFDSHRFIPCLQANLPPLAIVKSLESESIPLQSKEAGFQMIESQSGHGRAMISPDVGICSRCLEELFNPKSRYYRYPFLNCTQCGPRFTITRDLPYDRHQTTMDAFVLCSPCQEDYSNPNNRRYHAQPTACSACGPALSLPIEAIAQRIRQGDIIALKSLGGYQFICDAQNEATVLRMREKKNRQAKPFALMVLNSQSAKRFVEMNFQEQRILESAARPIVLLKKKSKEEAWSHVLAPDLHHLGIMLPYTPLHYLLFNALANNPDGSDWLHAIWPMVLVVTSANQSNEPLMVDDAQAMNVLPAIADCIVSYNRPIHTRLDDSVVRIVNQAPLVIRRARGFVPTPIALPHAIPATLALGGHQKNTFCLTRGNEAFVSQHIGSLNNPATIEFFHESLQHWLRFLSVKPERVAHDLHPDFYTTRCAKQFGVSTFAIQHHHAHLASVVAEQGGSCPTLGLVLDGYGYGVNGEAWGGELLFFDGTSCVRLGGFSPLLQPGGDIAVREPWRMAASVLHHLGRGDEITKRFAQYPHATAIEQLLVKKLHCSLTSSCGRLFDAASALLGVQAFSHYEGQAAMRLESLVEEVEIMPQGWRIQGGDFDLLPTFEKLANMRSPIRGANVFHGTLIAGLCAWIVGVCHEKGLDRVVLTGGCFLNAVLAEGLVRALNQHQIQAILPRQLPPNDGGISLGQAWIAGVYS